MIGDQEVTNENFKDVKKQLRALGAAMGDDGKLVLLNCGAGNNPELLQKIARVTGCSVTATKGEFEVNGNESNGDWVEVKPDGSVTPKDAPRGFDGTSQNLLDRVFGDGKDQTYEFVPNSSLANAAESFDRNVNKTTLLEHAANLWDKASNLISGLFSSEESQNKKVWERLSENDLKERMLEYTINNNNAVVNINGVEFVYSIRDDNTGILRSREEIDSQINGLATNSVGVIRDAVKNNGLTSITFSSLARPGHFDGHGIDIISIGDRDNGNVTVQDYNNQSIPESSLVTRFRNNLINDQRVNQVLDPWKLYCRAFGTVYNETNNWRITPRQYGDTALQHNNHMHISVRY